MPIIDPDREPQDLTPYQRAESWLYMMWMDVYHKCMVMIEQKIIDAGGSLGGGGKREFGYQIPGDLVGAMGGPVIPNATGEAITFTTAIATAGTAPVGSDITCSLDVNGTTVSFTISDGTNSSTKQTGLSVAWAADSLITGSIATVGSTTPGSNLSMVLSE